MPPLLPARWQSSYVSHVRPMRPSDRVTNGHAWFDYERGVSRIDGFVNPWDEAATGYRLWVSEVHELGARCRRLRLAYTVTPEGVTVRRLEDTDAPASALALPRDLLRARGAQRATPVSLLGREAIPWTLAGPPATTLYLCATTALPLRMCVEKEPGHVSLRDFLTADDRPIPADVFAPLPWPACPATEVTP